MTINPRTIQAILAAAYLSLPRQVFGHQGENALRILFDAVGMIYEEFPPDALPNGITVIAPSDPEGVEVVLAPLGDLVYHADAASVANLLRATGRNYVVVGVASDGSYRSVLTVVAPVLATLATGAVVYNHDGRTERLLAGTENKPIPRCAAGLASNLAKPTFQGLGEALDNYERTARDTQCDTLANVWEGGVDGPRLVLTARPERHMRDSLHRALAYMLRHADVSREHNTDDTKPVDIRIKWRSSNVEALIEIKWLGRSLTSGCSKDNPSYTEYRPARAQEGASQLADYLEREKSNSGASALKCYLVVFDARRRRVNGPADRLNAENALYFEHADLTFDPDHAKLRPDFEKPRRYFMAPRADHFLEQVA